MKQKPAHHEVLILTNTCYSKKQMLSTRRSYSFAATPDACWNGLLLDIVPDAVPSVAGGTWKYAVSEHFIQVQITTGESVPARKNSLNPYLFLTGKNSN